MNTPDIRWKQRFANYQSALQRLEDAVATNTEDRLSQEGVIQRFEFTFELAWKCLQDVFVERGLPEVRGPKPVLQQALTDNLISNGLIWMEMLKARNAASHMYDEAVFLKIYEHVRHDFLGPLQNLRTTFESL